MKKLHQYIEESVSWNMLQLYIFSCVIILCIVKWSFPIHDFANYYFGAKSIFSPFDIYDPVLFNEFIQRFGPMEVFANYSPHSPLTKWMFLPLSWLDPYSAKSIFNLISAGLFSCSLIRFARFENFQKTYLLAVPLLCFTAILFNVQFGQAYLLFSAFLLEIYLASQLQKEVRIAVFFSFAFILKFTAIFFLIYIVFKKHYKAALFGSLILFSSFALDFSFCGLHSWKVFIFEILPRASDGLVNAGFVYEHHSVNALLKYLFIADSVYNPSLSTEYNWVYQLLNKFFLFILISFSILFSLRKEKLAAFAFITFTIYSSASILSQYSAILLLIPFLVLNRFGTKSVLAFAFLMILQQVVLKLDLDPLFRLILEVLIIFSMLAILIVSTGSGAWKTAVLSSIILSLPFVSKAFPESKGILMTKPYPLDISISAELDGNDVIVKSYGVNSFHKVHLTSSDFLEPIQLNAQSIVLNDSLISLPDNVQAAYLLDDERLLYLSDNRHGYHFFQPWILKLDE